MRSRVEPGRATRRFFRRGFRATGDVCDSGVFIRVPEYMPGIFRTRPASPTLREDSMKQALGVLVGFILWSALWLAVNQVLLMVGLLAPPTTRPLTDAMPLI